MSIHHTQRHLPQSHLGNVSKSLMNFELSHHLYYPSFSQIPDMQGLLYSVPTLAMPPTAFQASTVLYWLHEIEFEVALLSCDEAAFP